MVFTYTTDNTGAGQTQYTITIPTGGVVCDILMVGGGVFEQQLLEPRVVVRLGRTYGVPRAWDGVPLLSFFHMHLEITGRHVLVFRLPCQIS